jgi:hypothetical protein
MCYYLDNKHNIHKKRPNIESLGGLAMLWWTWILIVLLVALVALFFMARRR